MTTPPQEAAERGTDAWSAAADTGLLSPVRAGTPVEDLVSDEAWAQAMLDAEAALARAQARLGTVPQEAAEAITRAARVEAFDLRALAVAARETANPVVGLVRALTAAVEPEAAPYVHRGSTSQDIFDTGAVLVARRALRSVREGLGRCAAALADLAGEHRDTVMAGRTLALHAVPTTFGLKAAGWWQSVLDADRRLAAVADALPVSLGGAAGTLAGYLVYAELDGPPGFDPDTYARRLVEAFAAETGLAAPPLPWHAARGALADLASALALTAGVLGKIAVDVQSMARTEVGEVAEPGRPGRGGSSAMPHKRNPVLATLLRSAALQVPPLATAVVQCLVAEDERSAGAWHAEWLPLRECLRLTGGAAHTAAELAEGLEVRPERMRRNLDLTGGQVVSERIAALLAPHFGRADSKRLLTSWSVLADGTGRSLHQVLADAPELAGVVNPAELADWCDPTRYTGAAGAMVRRALDADSNAT